MTDRNVLLTATTASLAFILAFYWLLNRIPITHRY